MKLLSIILLLSFSSLSIAGSHGIFQLSCVSESLRTHLYVQLNDYDFIDEALYPQLIVISTMGVMNIFNKSEESHYYFKTNRNTNNFLEIYSTDKEKSYILKVDFRKESSAKIVMEKGINPRTNKGFSGLEFQCTKNHSL